MYGTILFLGAGIFAIAALLDTGSSAQQAGSVSAFLIALQALKGTRQEKGGGAANLPALTGPSAPDDAASEPFALDDIGLARRFHQECRNDGSTAPF